LALSFLYLAFVRTIQLLFDKWSDDSDLAIEPVEAGVWMRIA
jgi:hypothetical protein